MSLYLDRLCTKLGYKNYNDYLSNPNWKVFSNYIKLKRKLCFCCNYKNNLSVHHINYDNLGYEMPKDVVVLCNSCHLKVHTLTKSRKASLKNAHIILREEYFPRKKKKSKAQKRRERAERIIQEWDRFTLQQMPRF